MEARSDEYVDLLLREAESRENEFSEKIETLFIGGGTPSLLSPSSLARLMKELRGRLKIAPDAEFTIEANPGTVTETWLRAAAEAGMNRLSLGMQAFQPELLRTLGRIHDFSQVRQTVALAHARGIRNLNLDLIFGIPGQTPAQWEQTLEAALSLEPVHISAYGLIPEEGTPLKQDLDAGKLSLPEPEEERAMYDTAIHTLKEQGFEQYEISNFARPGYACRHNIGYWKQAPYVGLGVSAASMRILDAGEGGMTCLRSTNPDRPEEYEGMLLRGKKPEEELVLPPEARFETMMLGLRMNEGVDEDAFMRMHGVALEEAYGEKLRKLEGQRLIAHENRRWKLTRRGFDIQNSILVELMDD